MIKKLRIFKNKKMFLVIGILLSALIGATLAYYYTEDTIDNEFVTEEYSSQSIENFTPPTDWKPGDTTPKTIKVKNNGTLCEKVRVSYTEKWESENGAILPNYQNGNKLTTVNLDNMSDWAKHGDYYYYMGTLEAGDETNSFMKSVTFNEGVINDYECTEKAGGGVSCISSGDGYDGATYTLSIKVETVYCEVANDAWGVEIDDIKPDTATFLRGDEFNSLLKTMASGTAKTENDDDTLIRAFVKSDRLPSNVILPSSTSSNKNSGSIKTLDNKNINARVTPMANITARIGSDEDSPMPIYVWYDNGTIYWYSEATTVYTPVVMDEMFKQMRSLTDISGLANIDMSKTGWASWIFVHCDALTDISPLATWDVSKVTILQGNFEFCSSLTDISPLANWDTSSNTTLANMFDGCTSLVDISPIANWDTSKATDFNCLLRDTGIINVDALANWDTSEVTDMCFIFHGCTSLTNINGLLNWDTSNVTRLAGTFYECSALTSINTLANWDVSKVTNMQALFEICENLQSLQPLSNWQTNNLQNLSHTFASLKVLTSLTGLENWNVSKVTTMEGTFWASNKVTSISALANWTTTSLTDMSNTFRSMTALTSMTGLENWNVSKVTTLSYCFAYDSTIVNVTPLTNWQTTNLTDLSHAFRNMTSLTGLGGVKNFNTAKVTTIEYMFYGNSKLPSMSSLSTWNVSKVTTMESAFRGMTKLTTIAGISSWNVSACTNMKRMFQGDTALTTVTGINAWAITKVKYTSNTEANNGFWYMFNGVTKKPTFSKRAGSFNSVGSYIPKNTVS